MKLYGYFRSSTTYRVRIALHLKGISFEAVPINLLAGEHREGVYSDFNPFGTVPTLDIDGELFFQSLAILEALDELYPKPSLLPADKTLRKICRELSFAIASEIHAPNNLRVLKYLKRELGLDQEQINSWYSKWVRTTFEPVEARLAADRLTTGLPFGERPGLFEVMLIPQIYNARRFGVVLSDFPVLLEIEKFCLTLPAFQAAHPDNQPDSPEG